MKRKCYRRGKHACVYMQDDAPLYKCDIHFVEWLATAKAKNAYENVFEDLELIIKFLNNNRYPELNFELGQKLQKTIPAPQTIPFLIFYDKVCEIARRAIMQIFLIGGIHKDVKKQLAKTLWENRVAWVNCISQNTKS